MWCKIFLLQIQKLPLISNVNQLNKLIYSTVKNKTAHIEFTTTYNADLKEAISRTGQQLSYSYKNIDRVNYTLYSVTFIYQQKLIISIFINEGNQLLLISINFLI